jgi:hypothetical protein
MRSVVDVTRPTLNTNLNPNTLLRSRILFYNSSAYLIDRIAQLMDEYMYRVTPEGLEETTLPLSKSEPNLPQPRNWCVRLDP